jgi:hypothetical protein
MSIPTRARLSSRLAEARQREQRFGRMALQEGIEPDQMFGYRQMQLSSRAEAELVEKALMACCTAGRSSAAFFGDFASAQAIQK